jgi:hypothetical protein
MNLETRRRGQPVACRGWGERTEHNWQLVEVDESEHGSINRYVCTKCGEERLSQDPPGE